MILSRKNQVTYLVGNNVTTIMASLIWVDRSILSNSTISRGSENESNECRLPHNLDIPHLDLDLAITRRVQKS